MGGECVLLHGCMGGGWVILGPSLPVNPTPNPTHAVLYAVELHNTAAIYLLFYLSKVLVRDKFLFC